jgi:hypothetical protein
MLNSFRLLALGTLLLIVFGCVAGNQRRAIEPAAASPAVPPAALPAISPVAPATIVCALSLPAESVKRVLGSGDTSDVKTKELITLTEEHSSPGWQTIQRREDIAASLTEIISALVAAETDEASVSTAIQSAFVAGCSQPTDKAASAITTAMREKAGLPKPDPKSSSSSDAATPGSASGFGAGDEIKLITAVSGFRNANNKADAGYTAPGGCVFFVSGSDPTNSYVQGYFKKYTHFYNFSSISTLFSTALPAGDADCAKEQEGKKIKQGTLYEIAGNTLKEASADIRGWQAGVLVAPYKFHFSDHSTQGSASIGGYVGYNYGNPAVTVTPIVSAGLGAVPVPASTTPSSTPTPGATTTHTSLTLASGVLFGIKKYGAFQVGLLVGIDWAGAGAHYKYEGKPWLSLSFGTSLTGPGTSK